jgi:hypothetical protein
VAISIISIFYFSFLYYDTNFKSPEIFQFKKEVWDDFVTNDDANEDKELTQDENKEIKKKREESLKLFTNYPYFRLPLISVPVIRDGYVHAHLYIFISMKAIDPKSYTKSRILLPRLIDGIFSDLYKAFENLWDERFDPKPSVIKARIFSVTEKVLGKDQIDTIYLREIIFKRINS